MAHVIATHVSLRNNTDGNQQRFSYHTRLPAATCASLPRSGSRESDYFHFHDLRRSFATRKVAEGWDRDYVKAITGHRTDKVFARYNKPSLEMLRAVVEGSPRTSVVKLLSNSPGRESATVLSA